MNEESKKKISLATGRLKFLAGGSKEAEMTTVELVPEGRKKIARGASPWEKIRENTG